MRILITFLLCLALAGSAVAAEKTVTAKRLDGEPIPTMAAPAGVCFFGNQNPVAFAITDWMWGSESYAVVFEATQPTCVTCTDGFTVEAVHMYVNFGLEDAPVTFDVSASFFEAEFVAAAGCVIPGLPIRTSNIFTVTIDNPGLYDISIPLPSDAECAFFGYDYAVGLNFHTDFLEYPDAVTDEFPVGCTSFNNYGTGWLDLADFGLPGELNIYADIVCCAPAVPSEDKAWGDVKSLFR